MKEFYPDPKGVWVRESEKNAPCFKWYKFSLFKQVILSSNLMGDLPYSKWYKFELNKCFQIQIIWEKSTLIQMVLV